MSDFESRRQQRQWDDLMRRILDWRARGWVVARVGGDMTGIHIHLEQPQEAHETPRAG